MTSAKSLMDGVGDIFKYNREVSTVFCFFSYCFYSKSIFFGKLSPILFSVVKTRGNCPLDIFH